MVLAMAIGMAQSVWFDEAYSILVAKQSIGDIIHLASVDTHPPLYYLLMHGWGSLFGWSEFALRSLSVLTYGGMIVVAMILMRRLFDVRTALVAGSLLLVAPLLMRYGFELRMYSIAMLIGVSATYVLVRARATKNSVWWWVAYAVLLAIGLGFLYYLAVIWIAHVVWLVLVTWRQWRTWWRTGWLWSYVGGAVLFLPQLPTFVSQLNNGALAAIGQPMNLEQLIGVVTFNTVYKPVWQVSVIETVLVLTVIAIVVYAAIRAMRDRKHSEARLLLLCYWAVPIIALMGISLSRPMYVERYLSHVAVGLVLWVAVVLAYIIFDKRVRRGLWYYGTILAVMVFGTVNVAMVGNFNFQRMQHPAIDQAAQAMGDCHNATIIAADPYVATELSYYLPGNCNMKFYSEQGSLGGGYAPFSNSPDRFDTTRVSADTQRLYYVYYGEPALTIDAQFVEKSNADYGNMKVVKYEAVR